MLSRDFKTSHFVVFNILARYYVMDAALEVGDSSSSQEEEKEPSSKKRYSRLFEMEAKFEIDDCSSGGRREGTSVEKTLSSVVRNG